MRKGLEQTEARKLARELGGIAQAARWSEKTLKWRTGGWPGKDQRWVVTTLDGRMVLADTLPE